MKGCETIQQSTQKKIDVMKAFIDGKKIEVKWNRSNSWEDADPYFINWDWVHFDFRIKK